MGGAYRALGLGTEAVLGNPAALALWRTYRIEGTGAYDTHTKDGVGSVGVTDAASGPLAAGFDYHYLSLRPETGRATGHFTALGLALPLSENFFIGASGRYVTLGGIDGFNAVSVDTGLLVRLAGSVLAGVSAHNLVGSNTNLLGRYYSAHVGYAAGVFTLATDARADFTGDRTRYNWGAGAEYIVAQAIPLRAGYSLDTATRDSQVSVGAGFLTEGGGIDLAYRHDFSDRASRLLALTFKIQLQ
ncbi:hypothetical protein FGE12_14945 [Aggregicoccus sp. 17bor-14]|nr:hypothetical protein [Simulacricoccus sp. 17bor-14]MRI89448.1 hypothetical protein [Aggregicoccus sp. 17bor-14]